MAATGTEVVTLEQLKMLSDNLTGSQVQLSILETGNTTMTLTSPAVALIGINSSKYDIVNRGESISDEYLLALSPDGTQVTCRRHGSEHWIALGAS